MRGLHAFNVTTGIGDLIRAFSRRGDHDFVRSRAIELSDFWIDSMRFQMPLIRGAGTLFDLS